MGYTNKTSHYDLPQWVASDKPSWLGDMNAAFLTIDNELESANSNADVAITTASGFDARITTIANAEQQNSTDIASLTNEIANAAGVANAALPKSGGTMTGPLNLSRNPITNLEAATKQYVDNAVATSSAGLTQTQADARYLQLDGGTMSGKLMLNANPTANMQAATKEYVDNSLTMTLGTPDSSAASYMSLGSIRCAVIQNVLLFSINSVLSSAIDSTVSLLNLNGNPLNLTGGQSYALGYIPVNSGALTVNLSYNTSANTTTITITPRAGTTSVTSGSYVSGAFVYYLSN